MSTAAASLALTIGALAFAWIVPEEGTWFRSR
jgi:hypothetical protein